MKMHSKSKTNRKISLQGKGKRFAAGLLLPAFLLSLTACTSVQAAELTADIKAGEVNGRAADEEFISAQMSFALNIFKGTYAKQPTENVLISPLSLMSALAMTANGAGGETLAEMESVLGGIPIDRLNEYLYTYLKKFSSEKKYRLELANSVWFRTSANVEYNRDFLQKTVDYYGSEVYASDFDDQTVTDVNNWVKSNTDGRIDKILDGIDDEAIMFIINALAFDARWDKVYKKSDVIDGVFTDINGNEQDARMMCSDEDTYIEDEKAIGFVKRYEGGRYKFAALLPNEGISLEEYTESLSAEGLLDTLQNSRSAIVTAQMPKFSYEYSVLMNDILSEAGMESAFGSAADFYGMGTPEEGHWIEISKVLHKTFIEVSEEGTKAAAVSFVQMDENSVAAFEEPERKTVILDRPFLYMIIDSGTDLPVFIGTVTEV